MPEAGDVAERLAWVRQFEHARDAASVCAQFGITRATLRKWWARYEAAGVAGLEDASRAPRTSPRRKVFAEQAALIQHLRGQGLGLARIRAALLADHALDVSVPTIRKALRPAPAAEAKPPPRAATPSLFAAALPDDELARALAAEIARGGFRPGDRLTEEALGRRFRAGRTRIRQALRALAMLGLVSIERNRGAVVATPSHQAVADAYEARRLIEAVIVRQFAQHPTAAGIAALRAHIARQAAADRSGDKVALVHLLTDFHLLLAGLAGNPFLRGFVETLATTTSLAVLLYDQSATPSCAVAEHSELVDLLERGQGDAAAELMAHHLGHNQQRLAP